MASGKPGAVHAGGNSKARFTSPILNAPGTSFNRFSPPAPTALVRTHRRQLANLCSIGNKLLVFRRSTEGLPFTND